jgi:hypothetical protein
MRQRCRDESSGTYRKPVRLRVFPAWVFLLGIITQISQKESGFVRGHPDVILIFVGGVHVQCKLTNKIYRRFSDRLHLF